MTRRSKKMRKRPRGSVPAPGSVQLRAILSRRATSRPLHETVQLKLRFSEALRRKLEEAALGNERSLNAEIIKRLERSFLESNRVSRLVADALLEGLDPDVIQAMSETIIEEWQSDQAASTYDWREDQYDREGK